MNQQLTGEQIRLMRKAAGISQTELAEGLLSISYLSLIESGKRLPRGSVMEEIAARLARLGQFLPSGPTALLSDALLIRCHLRTGNLVAAKEAFQILTEGAFGTSRSPLVVLLELEISAYEGKDLRLADQTMQLVTRLEPHGQLWLEAVTLLCQVSQDSISAESALALALEIMDDPRYVDSDLATLKLAALKLAPDLDLTALTRLAANNQGVPNVKEIAARKVQSALAHRAAGANDRFVLELSEAQALMDLAQERADSKLLLLDLARRTLHAEAGDPKQALAWLEKVMVGESVSYGEGNLWANAQALQAFGYARLGKTELAEKSLQSVITFSTTDNNIESADRLIASSCAYRLLGDLPTALADLRSAQSILETLEQNRDLAQRWQQVSSEFEAHDDVAQALAAMKRATACLGVLDPAKLSVVN